MSHEVREIQGKPMVIEKKKPFFTYVREKFKVDDPVGFLASLKETERKKVFLKWKWGLSHDEANYSLETTRRQILTMIPGIDAMRGEYEQEYWRLIIEFEKKCVEYRKTIGLKTYFVPELWIESVPF